MVLCRHGSRGAQIDDSRLYRIGIWSLIARRILPVFRRGHKASNKMKIRFDTFINMVTISIACILQAAKSSPLKQKSARQNRTKVLFFLLIYFVRDPSLTEIMWYRRIGDQPISNHLFGSSTKTCNNFRFCVNPKLRVHGRSADRGGKSWKEKHVSQW